MAETIKKSRIVSEEVCDNLLEDNSSLQDIINEEFNQRLKNCMKDDVDNNDEQITVTYEETVLKNGHSNGDLIPDYTEDLIHTEVLNSEDAPTFPDTIRDTEAFLESERQNGLEKPQESPSDILSDPENDSFTNDENLGLESSPEEIPFETTESAKDRFLSTVTDLEEETNISATAKDRLFLSTDSACLLFTQTVVQSPMLTPTDENYDFLQGLSNASATPPEDSSKAADVENSELLTETILTETVEQPVCMQSIKEITEDFIEIERKISAEEREEREEVPLQGKMEIDGEIPVVRITEVTPESEEKEFLDLEEEYVIGDGCVMEDLEDSHIEETEPAVIVAEEIVTEKVEITPVVDVPTIHEEVEDQTEALQNEDLIEEIQHIQEEIIEVCEQLEEISQEPNFDAISDKPQETLVSETETIERPQTIEQQETNEELPTVERAQEQTVEEHETKEEILDAFETVQKTKEIFEKISSPEGGDSCLPKSVDLLKQLDISPCKSEEEDEVFDDNNASTNEFSTTTTSESSFMETSTAESKGHSDKSLKKKKSKKSKKESEKENISVNDINTTNDEDCLSHVSVRNLCRSFSDLTSINDSRSNDNLKLRTKQKNGRAKSLSDIRRDLPTNHPVENVFGGVSVKQLKSSFSKFDALQKKTVLHVRSTEGSKAQEKFNGPAPVAETKNCKACSKQVFQMEQIKAEKAIWHKNCFRCQECNKQLTVDTYQSNEGILYCKPHFKSLFAPKAVEESQPMRPRKHELIIRENQPEELPPDVVRASDKPDLGLEELQNLNVKERFQVFQNHQENENNLERTPSAVNVKRSPSILSKLARFQQKGMDIGVNDESLNGVPVELSSSESEEEDDGITGEDADLIRARRAQREKPLHFNNMSDIMSKWESGNQMSKEERREERKQEIQSIRSRLFMGKQAKIKEMYQQAVAESESGAHVKKLVATEVCENAKLIKEKFEKGEPLSQEEEQKLKDSEDMSVFESGISKKSRSIFLELDAHASKPPSMTPISPIKSSSDVRKVREAGSPDRDIYHDPDVIRSEEQVDDSDVVQKSHTATKMLSIFRQMEENVNKEPQALGPKPLKRFTPPPEPIRDESSSEEEDSGSEDEEEDESDREEMNKLKDEDLIEAQKAARAKQLRAKFEKWEANELQREQNSSSVNIAEELGEEQSQIESAKSLRARFESMREAQTTKERPKVKVNRFVDTTNNVETCKSCEGKVYPLEKVSCHNNVYHKNCFRCRECNTILRLDSYTYNQGLLYCIPHFKRLFIAKGNYESGFGLGQHKEKWNAVS